MFAALMLTASMGMRAQSDDILSKSEENGWEYELRAGVNVGGATPVPLPTEIRKIKSYNPGLHGSFEGVVTKWMGAQRKWGASVGLRIENKGMKTGADVKNYGMEIIDEGSNVAGYWTGYVNTKYNATMLTVPVMANYRFCDRWKVRAGLFASWKLDGEFGGYVTDGYLRQGTPVGEKATFENGNKANYNFDGHLRSFQWGAQVGGSWRAYRHFWVNADLTWGLSDVFEHSFKTVSFNLYPIYLNVGFGYQF
jgi:hypothetical protein